MLPFCFALVWENNAPTVYGGISILYEDYHVAHSMLWTKQLTQAVTLTSVWTNASIIVSIFLTVYLKTNHAVL